MSGTPDDSALPAHASNAPPQLPPPVPEPANVGMPIEVDDCDGSADDGTGAAPMSALRIMRREREPSTEDYPLDHFIASCDEADSATTPHPPSLAPSQFSQREQSSPHKQHDDQSDTSTSASGVGVPEPLAATAAQDGNSTSDVHPAMTHSVSVGSVGSTSSAVLGALGVLDRSSSRHNAKGGGGGTGSLAGAASQGGSSSSSKARRSSRKVLDRPRSSSWASFDDYGGYSSGERTSSTSSGHGSVRKRKEKKHARERERKERVVESYHQHYGDTSMPTAASTNISTDTIPAAPIQHHHAGASHPPVSHIQQHYHHQQQPIIDPTDDAAGRPTPPPPPPLPSQPQHHAHQIDQQVQDHALYQQQQQEEQQQHYHYQEQPHYSQQQSPSGYGPPSSNIAQQQYEQHLPSYPQSINMAPPMAAAYYHPGHASVPLPHFSNDHGPSGPASSSYPASKPRSRRGDGNDSDGDGSDSDGDDDEGDAADLHLRQASPSGRTKASSRTKSSPSSRKHGKRHQSHSIGSVPSTRYPQQQGFPVEHGYPQGCHHFYPMPYTLGYPQQQHRGPHGEHIMSTVALSEQQLLVQQHHPQRRRSSRDHEYHSHPPQYGIESDGSLPTLYSEEKSEERPIEVASYSNSHRFATNSVGPITHIYPYGSQQSERRQFSKRSSVSFSTIEIRSYERVLGDNPSCSHGPAVSIGWQYEPDPITVQVDEFEYYRAGDRLDGTALVLSRCEREEMLEELGYTRSAIADAVRTNVKVKNNRRQTVHNLPVARLEEAAESAKRKLKRVVLGRKKDKQYACRSPTSSIKSGDGSFSRKSSLRNANSKAPPTPARAPPPNKMLPLQMVAHSASPPPQPSSHPPAQYRNGESSTGTAAYPKKKKKKPVIVSEENSLPLEAFDGPSIGASFQGYGVGTGRMAYDSQYQFGQYNVNSK